MPAPVQIPITSDPSEVLSALQKIRDGYAKLIQDITGQFRRMTAEVASQQTTGINPEVEAATAGIVESLSKAGSVSIESSKSISDFITSLSANLSGLFADFDVAATSTDEFEAHLSDLPSTAQPAARSVLDLIRILEVYRDKLAGVEQTIGSLEQAVGQTGAKAAKTEVPERKPPGVAEADRGAALVGKAVESASKTTSKMRANVNVLIELLSRLGIIEHMTVDDFMKIFNEIATIEDLKSIVAKKTKTPISVFNKAVSEARKEIDRMVVDMTTEEGKAEALAKAHDKLTEVFEASGIELTGNVDALADAIVRTVHYDKAIRDLSEATGISQQAIRKSVSALRQQEKEMQHNTRSTVTRTWEQQRALDVLMSTVQGTTLGLAVANKSLINFAMSVYFMRTAILKIMLPVAGLTLAVVSAGRALGIYLKTIKQLTSLILKGLRGAVILGAKLIGSLFRKAFELGRKAISSFIEAVRSSATHIAELDTNARKLINTFSAMSGSAASGVRNWVAATSWAIRYGFAIEDISGALTALWRSRIIDRSGEALKTAMMLANAFNISLEEAVSALSGAIGETEGNVASLQDYNIQLSEATNSLDFMARRTAVLQAVQEKYARFLDARINTIEGNLQRIRTSLAALFKLAAQPIVSDIIIPILKGLGNLTAALAQTAAQIWRSDSFQRRWQKTAEKFRDLIAKFTPELNFLVNILRLGLGVAMMLVVKAFDKAIDYAGRFLKFIRQLRIGMENFGRSIKPVDDMLRMLSGDMKDVTFQDLLQAAKDLLYNLVPNLDAIIEKIETFVNFVKYLLEEFLLKPAQEFLGGFAKAFGVFLPLAGGHIDNFLNSLEDLQQALQPLADSFQALSRAAGGALGVVFGTGLVVASTALESLSLLMQGKKDEIPGLWSAMWQEVGKAIDTAWTETIGPALSEARTKLLEWVGNTFGEEAQQRVDDFLANLEQSFNDWLGDETLGEKIAGIGQQITDAIINLPEQIGKMEGLDHLIDSIGNAFKSLFGIFKSGSDDQRTLTERVGDFIERIDRVAGSVADALDSLARLLEAIGELRRSFRQATGGVGFLEAGIRSVLAVIELGADILTAFAHGITDAIGVVTSLWDLLSASTPEERLKAFDELSGHLVSILVDDAELLTSTFQGVIDITGKLFGKENLHETIISGLDTARESVMSFSDNVLLDLVGLRDNSTTTMEGMRDGTTKALYSMRTQSETTLGTFKVNALNLITELKTGAVELFANLQTEATTVISSFISDVEDRFTVWSDNIVTTLDDLKTRFGEKVDELKTTAGDKFEAVVDKIKEKLQPFIDLWNSLFGDGTHEAFVTTVFKQALQGMIDFFTTKWNSLENFYNLLSGILSFIIDIPNRLSTLLSSLDNVTLPGYQSGGIIRSESVVRVAEGNRPEAIVPLASGAIPVRLLGATPGGPTVNIYVTGNTILNDRDADRLARIISDKIASSVRGHAILPTGRWG